MVYDVLLTIRDRCRVSLSTKAIPRVRSSKPHGSEQKDRLGRFGSTPSGIESTAETASSIDVTHCTRPLQCVMVTRHSSLDVTHCTRPLHCVVCDGNASLLDRCYTLHETVAVCDGNASLLAPIPLHSNANEIETFNVHIIARFE